MKRLDLRRCAVSTCAAVALLSGCRGVQPIGTPGVAVTIDNAQSQAGRGSETLGGDSSGDLLYLADGANHFGLVVYSYPALKKVGQIDIGGFGLCSDQSGHVFVPAYDSGGRPVVYEFAHDGTQPIATFFEYADDAPIGCSVDPTTGNLAVTNNDGNDYFGCKGPGNVAIFAGAKGQSTTYCTGPAVLYAYACGYDDAGNLYVDGEPALGSNAVKFGVLRYGSNSVDAIALNRRLEYPRAVQWDGSYITIETAGGKSAPKIFALQVSGSKGRIVRTTNFEGIRSEGAFGLSWIQATTVVMPGAGAVGLFPYPKGGKASRTLTHVGRRPISVTISVPPSH